MVVGKIWPISLPVYTLPPCLPLPLEPIQMVLDSKESIAWLLSYWPKSAASKNVF